MKIILALLFFGFMIFIHEFGHFITARLFKVGVREFAIGMGPKVFSKKSEKTGTLWSFRALPIGGFVSLVGEDEEVDSEDSLSKKAWYKRFIILFSGSFMNILTAVIAMFIILSADPYYASTVVCDWKTRPLTESVIYDAGIRDGDRIVEINGKKINVWQDVSHAIMTDGTAPVDITVERGEERLIFKDVQFKTDTLDGISFGVVDFGVYALKKTFPNLIREAFFKSFSTVKMIYSSLFDLVSGKYGLNAVSGPVGTINVIAESTASGVRSVAMLFVFISMNLGVMNLLPFPALDGGRIVFVLIEAVRGKPLKPEVEGYVHFIGIILLLALMAVVTFKDVIKLI